MRMRKRGRLIVTGDLHCHTKLSDGSVGIEELISIAKKSNLDCIAITDHDTLAGTVRGKVIGERQGLKVIPGVELSSFDYKRGRKVHILCYLSDTPNRLEGLCKRTSMERKKAGQIMIMKAMQKFPLSAEHIMKCASGSTNLYKQHIMHALMDIGYTTTVFGELYQQLFNKNSPDCISTPVKYPDVYEVMDSIHEAGGIAVMAHPAEYDSFDLIEELVPAGLDGVEVWHPRASEEDRERILAIAKQHDLLTTGGTDFHGMYNSRPLPLGTCCTPAESLEALLNYKAKKRRAMKKAEQEAQPQLATSNA